MSSVALPRRKFLKTIGTVAVASAIPDVLIAAQTKPPSVAVFWEPGFPEIEGCGITRETFSNLPVTFLTTQELITQLNTTRFDLLINPCGSAFPKRAWKVILKYLREGGNWLNIGGVPLSRPVVHAAGKWRAEAHQTTYHKRLGITHSFPVNTSQVVEFETADNLRDGGLLATGFNAQQIFELYVRLSSSSNEPDEAGSDGPHEGVVQPLLLGNNKAGRAIAAPVIQIDRWLADFAGGRWVFANFRGNLNAKAVAVLVERALQGASCFRVKSEFACYKPGEIPTVSVELTRPKGHVDDLASYDCTILVSDKADQVVSRLDLTLNSDNTKASASSKLENDARLPPGFYTLLARMALRSLTGSTSYEITSKSGFWVYDEALMQRGKPLTVDKHFFYRDGWVFPVTGATYMASDVHRRFLFEPNPFVWDNDFRQMDQAGVNMVRTGIWTGWKKYMPQPGKVDETVLRAFDAFLLTAHKYDIPVIFTFFAFLPETWGGENAYLDPRAVKAQQQFISAFTERCRNVDDVIWDFINEPSFCSPKHLWNCRPNYDAHERAAWKQWLRERYPAATDEEHVGHLQQLWRTTVDDPLDLPRLQDFESVHLIDDRLPLKTLDYRLFAQEMFMRWVREMTIAIKNNGNTKQLITVGQDEAGLGDSPNIQFWAPLVDFTSLHNWWNNDDLVWDSVLAKTPAKLSLMEETGVMFYEKPDGSASWRSEEEVSRLLERKLALSFAADGAGFIEWIWNTNPYMNSTNEVGIGFYRVDGTAKPELEPFLDISQFMAEHGRLLKDRVSERVAMVIPHSQMFSPRSFAHEATRKCVRAMYYHCGVPMQAVSEYTIGDYAGQADLIVVPSPRVLTKKCWDALVWEASKGATIAISGPINRDEHWLPASRIDGIEAQAVPVAESELIAIDRRYLVRYDGEKMQRLEKAVVEAPARPRVFRFGSGRMLWCHLPLELGDSMDALSAFYNFALQMTGVAPIFSATPRTPAVLILPSVFRDVVLYTFVSETDRDTQMQITHLESRTRFNVSVAAGRTAMVLLDRKTGKVLST